MKKCTKKSFHDKQQATHSLHIISNHASNSSTGKKPTRAYQCNICKKWHLTSQEE